MKTADLDYELPPELIAQTPIEPRDQARLLVLHRDSGSIEHRTFREIGEYLQPGDVLVANNSRVVPARLRGRKRQTAGAVEVLLLEAEAPDVWLALVNPGRRVHDGTIIEFERDGASAAVNQQAQASAGIGPSRQGSLWRPQGLEPLPKAAGMSNAHCKAGPLASPRELWAEVLGRAPGGARRLRFSAGGPELEAALEYFGAMPLPPYIHAALADPDRYQTVYAEAKGSVAAPTAGLHFTPRLLEELGQRGVRVVYVTVHIGLHTFRPIRTEELEEHEIHREYCTLSADVAEACNAARARGRRIVAVGTSSVRALESAGRAGEVQPYAGWTNLYIYPGYRYRAVDAMITNFHLPRTTLLALVSAFATPELIRRAYQEAIRERYRFYSFGDACLLQ